MAMIDFLREIDDEVKIINSSDFNIEITETNYVPRFNDPNITFGNLDTKIKKCKRLESCVLYVDIRNSAQMSADKMPETLAKVYSSFVSSMIAAARYNKGHIRNIIGDRVMVVFDKENCFTNAVETAILMNTIAHHIINKYVRTIDFKCGIGIDYGKMLVTKTGIIKRGEEKDFHRSLVWLGRPANIASRLTDIANKTFNYESKVVKELHFYPSLEKDDQWHWYEFSYENFINRLETTYSRNLKHQSEYFANFIKSSQNITNKYLPILMTENVYKGYKSENPNADSIKSGWWAEKSHSISEYNGKIYEGNIYKKAVEEL